MNGSTNESQVGYSRGMTDTLMTNSEETADTIGQMSSNVTPDNGEGTGTNVDWETVHQSYVKRQNLDSLNDNQSENTCNVDVPFTKQDYFGSESSVFTLTENNVHFMENVQLMERSALPDELTEAGFDEENLDDLVHRENGFSRPITDDVRSVKLSKELKSNNIQKNTKSSGDRVPNITLLDMSSINEIKKMWSKSDSVSVGKKHKKVNPFNPPPAKKAKMSTMSVRKKKYQPLIHADIKKPETVSVADAAHTNLKVKIVPHRRRTYTAGKGKALKTSTNTQVVEKSLIHTKPCSVQVKRIESMDFTFIPNLKVDLAIPNMVTMKPAKTSIQKNNKTQLKNKMKSDTPVFSHKTFKSKKNSKAAENRPMIALDRTTNLGNQKVVNDIMNCNTTLMNSNNKVNIAVDNEFDDSWLEEIEIEDAGDADSDYVPSDAEHIDSIRKQKTRKLWNAKNNCDDQSDKNSVKIGIKAKKKHYRNKGTGRIGTPPKKGHFECKHCDFVADEKNLVEKHYKKLHMRHWKNCKYCDFKSRSEDVLLEHTAKQHTHDKPFKCDYEGCEYASNNRTDLHHHGSKHSTTKDYTCELCPYKTKWRRNLRGHKTLVHTTERPFSCNICGGTFKRNTDLTDHMYRHTDEKPLQCSECGFRCKTNFELQYHMTKHSDDRPFKCTFPGCNQARKTKSDATKHMKIHLTTFDYVCPICEKAFKTKQNLRKHHNYMHLTNPGERPFQCDICQRRYRARNALGKHLKLHAGIYPFKCDVCNHRFSTKTNLQTHLVVHEDDRPFHCPVCPYRYKDSGSLLAHIGYFHGNSYAYFCEICKKPWKRYSQLQIHYKRMHTKKEIAHIGSEKEIDLALLKMEMKLELEQAVVEKVEKRPRGRPKKKKKGKGGKKNPNFEVEIKQEPADDYEATCSEVVTSSGAIVEQSNKIRDVRLNEATGEIEVVSDQGVMMNTFISKKKIESMNGLQEPDSEENEQHPINNSDLIANSVVDVDLYEEEDTPTESNVNGNTSSQKVSNINLSMKIMTEAHDCSRENLKQSTEFNDLLNVALNSEDTTKTEAYKNIEKPKATLAVYDDLRLPLATKGFEFNYEKNGKKPKSWFMDPDNMHGLYKEKMKKYLRSVGKLPPLPRGRPPPGPRGPRGPYKKRNLTAFIQDRKRKLNKNVKQSLMKPRKIKLMECDMSEVKTRPSTPRNTRYKGNYSEPEQIPLFETVSGDDLSYTQVIERLPKTLKDTCKLVSECSIPTKGSVSKKKYTVSHKETINKNQTRKCLPKVKTKTCVKRKIKESKIQSSKTSVKQVLKNRVKVTPIKKKCNIASEKISKKTKIVGKSANIKSSEHEEVPNQEDTSFSERNSFETLQKIVSEFLSQPDDSSQKYINSPSKKSKNATSKRQKDPSVDGTTKAKAPSKGLKRKYPIKDVKQKKTETKLKIKITGKKSLTPGSNQSQKKLKKSNKNFTPQTQSPTSNFAVHHAIHMPVENSPVVMVYPPGYIQTADNGNYFAATHPDMSSHNFKIPDICDDVHIMQNLEVPQTVLGPPQVNTDTVYMPCKSNIDNHKSEISANLVHPVLLTHTPSPGQVSSQDIVPSDGFVLQSSQYDHINNKETDSFSCIPNFDENSAFRLSESNARGTRYSACSDDGEDEVTSVNTSNSSDDRVLMMEEYLVIKREDSSDRE